MGNIKLKSFLKESINDKNQVKYVQWAKDEIGFTPLGRATLTPKLEPGTYRVETYPQLKLIPTDSKTDELMVFRESAMNRVMTEINRFWELKPNFDKLGYLHNRGILLFGPPGTGKSSLLQQVSKEQTSKNEITLFSHGLAGLQAGLQCIRTVEPNRRLVVILEDIDGYDYNERELLQLLDGENNINNVLYIATTNYKNKLSERLMRPGRFDKHVFIDYPDFNSRYTYLENKLKNIESPDKIKQITEKTQGFSFGHLKELIISSYAFKEDIDKTIQRLKTK